MAMYSLSHTKIRSAFIIYIIHDIIREVETRILLLELVGQHHRSIVYTDPRGRSAVSNPILRYI